MVPTRKCSGSLGEGALDQGAFPEGARILEWLISEHHRTGHGSMDGWVMTHVCPNRQVFCTNPMIATQRPSFSDIDNKMATFGEDIKNAFEEIVKGLEEK